MKTDIHREKPFMTELREPSWFNRIVSSIVIISIGGLTVVPAVAAAQQEIEQAIVQAAESKLSPETEMSGVVLSIMDELGNIQSKLGAADDEESEKVVDTSDEDEALEKLTVQLFELDEEVMADFDEIGVMLEDKDLPDVIVERHEQAVAKYRNELVAVLEGVEQIRATKDQKARFNRTTELASRLKSMRHKRSQQHFDPAELPSRSLQRNIENKPKVTALELILADPIGDARNLMANTGDSLPTGDDAFTNPDWLSESDEVKLTQLIIDKAAELGNDPVAIYNWVRNDIRWNPNWGAKQTAQLTMELGSGNAMDIATLTVALMRAANIPARYVHGTIDVPEDKFRNWAGGFEEIDSAIDYAASGGIPIGPVLSGGSITKVRMEHIWVEVAVDYVPSRAAVNVNADSWIPVDPSFKQFEFQSALDISGISGLDLGKVANDYYNSGQVNEAEGWVSDFDPTLIEGPIEQGQLAIQNYVDTNLQDSTILDLFGGGRTIVQDFPQLGSELPNRTISKLATYKAIPTSLQQKWKFAFSRDILGEAVDTTIFPWAQVNNAEIFLRFSPATSSDVAVLDSLLPETGITDLSQIPSSFSSYLVNVIPELVVDGEVVKVGSAMTLGEELVIRFDATFVNIGTVPHRYSLPVGSYLSIAAIGNDVSSRLLDKIADRLTETLGHTGDPNVPTVDLQRTEVLGDQFLAGILGYYAQYVSFGDLMVSGNNSQTNLMAGLGSFGYEPVVDTLLGIPRSIRPGAIIGNLPMVRVIGENSSAVPYTQFSSKKDINFALGIVSSFLEHEVPEHLYANANSTPQAISAVKAIGIAASQGQHIYKIDSTNSSSILDSLNHAAPTIDEISAAVAAGKHVIIHASSIVSDGFVGAGYIIFDPDTGDGAFKIGGGANGFFLILAAFFLVAFLLVTHVWALAPVLTLVVAGIEILTFNTWVENIENSDNAMDLNEAHTKAALFIVVAFLFEAAVLAKAGAEAILLAFSLAFGKMVESVTG